MVINDKRGILQTITKGCGASLELGCGSNKRVPASIGIDIIDSACVDIVGDIYDILHAIPDGSIASIYSHHFLEHVPQLEVLMREIARVMQVGGVFEAIVPHFSNPYFYSDPTHRNCFGLYTYSYYAKDNLFKRGVPGYIRSPLFELRSVRLSFKSTPPFFIRHGLKQIIGLIINSCTYLMEFYEENLCYIIPCYEIHYRLCRLSGDVGNWR